MATIELILVRTVARRADVAVVRNHLATAIRRALKAVPTAGFPKVAVFKTDAGFTATVSVTHPSSKEVIHDRIREVITERVTTQFDPPWLRQEEAQADAPAAPTEPTPRPIGTINLDFPPDAFSRIYGREAQIRRLTDALSLGRDTNWAKRKHTLFLGPPGCGKTETLLTFARHLGEEGKAWIWFDATSTTRAGAIEMLMKSATVPPILFVEEIEKTHESSLRWLLGVMDERGEIRRTNYRVGNQVKAIKLCVVATCNNEQLLKSMDAGALHSRFANRVYCPEPSRKVLQQILTREVTEMDNARPAWVDKTLTFGYDELGIRDPRELINMVLCGRDRLLDGSYQADFKATISPADRKNVLS